MLTTWACLSMSQTVMLFRPSDEHVLAPDCATATARLFRCLTAVKDPLAAASHVASIDPSYGRHPFTVLPIRNIQQRCCRKATSCHLR